MAVVDGGAINDAGLVDALEVWEGPIGVAAREGHLHREGHALAVDGGHVITVPKCLIGPIRGAVQTTTFELQPDRTIKGHPGPVSISDKTSYRKISQSIEAAIFVFIIL